MGEVTSFGDEVSVDTLVLRDFCVAEQTMTVNSDVEIPMPIKSARSEKGLNGLIHYRSGQSKAFACKSVRYPTSDSVVRVGKGTKILKGTTNFPGMENLEMYVMPLALLGNKLFRLDVSSNVQSEAHEQHRELLDNLFFEKVPSNLSEIPFETYILKRLHWYSIGLFDKDGKAYPKSFVHQLFSEVITNRERPSDEIIFFRMEKDFPIISYSKGKKELEIAGSKDVSIELRRNKSSVLRASFDWFGKTHYSRINPNLDRITINVNDLTYAGGSTIVNYLWDALPREVISLSREPSIHAKYARFTGWGMGHERSDGLIMPGLPDFVCEQVENIALTIPKAYDPESKIRKVIDGFTSDELKMMMRFSYSGDLYNPRMVLPDRFGQIIE